MYFLHFCVLEPSTMPGTCWVVHTCKKKERKKGGKREGKRVGFIMYFYSVQAAV